MWGLHITRSWRDGLTQSGGSTSQYLMGCLPHGGCSTSLHCAKGQVTFSGDCCIVQFLQIRWYLDSMRRCHPFALITDTVLQYYRYCVPSFLWMCKASTFTCCTRKGIDEDVVYVYKNCVCVQLWVQAGWTGTLYDGQFIGRAPIEGRWKARTQTWSPCLSLWWRQE